MATLKGTSNNPPWIPLARKSPGPGGISARLSAAAVLAMLAMGCTPTVQVAPPKEPITINLNVKVQHEIRLKVDKELEEVISEDSPLF